MNTKTLKSQYFISNLPEQAQKLFYDDPKQFKTLYRNKLVKIVKQDILKLGKIVTPVYEIDHHSDWYDSWRTEHYWYYIKCEFQQNAIDLFKIYCPNGISNISINKFKATNKEFFNLLRNVYYYTNYNDRKMWNMPDIQPLNISSNRDCNIISSDFVVQCYNCETKKKSIKLKKSKLELSKEIKDGCEKIVDMLIDKEINRIININEQIKHAKEILAKYGTELIHGY